jgi:hypothetical protein
MLAIAALATTISLPRLHALQDRLDGNTVRLALGP